MDKKNEVVIYTDGGAIGNPGPGGYGAVLIAGGRRKEVSQGFRLTTNNRMEISAAIAALRQLKYKCKVTLYSDSRYVVDAMTQGWVTSWKAKGWKRSKNQPALNSDLWQQLLDECNKHEVDFKWVRGHSGVLENERCDALTQEAIKGGKLAVDKIYEQSKGAS